MADQINSIVIRAMRPLFAGLIGIALVQGFSRQGDDVSAGYSRSELTITIPAAN